MNKAVCYVRVSTEEQAREGVSLEAQEEKLRAYCKMAGLEIIAMLREEGVSGSKPLATRPEGAKLVHLVETKQCQHVVALKLDRLFRDAEDALHQTRKWDNAGVSLHLVDMGGQVINTGSAMGRFFLSMMASFAELERNMTAERTATALAHKKANREAYAPTPYGFDRIGTALVPNHTEQQNIRFMADLRAAGYSYARIAEALNARGVPTKQGGKWYASTVSYILNNKLHIKEVA